MPRWRGLGELLLQLGHPLVVAVRAADQTDRCPPDERQGDLVAGRCALQLDLRGIDRRQKLGVEFAGLVPQLPKLEREILLEFGAPDRRGDIGGDAITRCGRRLCVQRLEQGVKPRAGLV
jgi:hypothetical protein